MVGRAVGVSRWRLERKMKSFSGGKHKRRTPHTMASRSLVPPPLHTMVRNPALHTIVRMVWHPLLKGEYTGHEKTYSGDVNISPRLAETKRNQQFLEKSVLPFFLGRSRFWLFHLFFLLNPGNPPPPPPLVHAAATRRGGAGGGSPGISRKNR